MLYFTSPGNMHELCGTNLDINEDARKLHFDADELPVNLTGNTCHLTITSSSTLSTNIMIMFYFTQFMFLDSCDDSNVTFINGASHNNKTAPGNTFIYLFKLIMYLLQLIFLLFSCACLTF